jgi:6-phosphogluconate dehydrogenase
MQIGVIGLGRMGANIVRRLGRGRHECVAYDADASVVARLAAEGLPALPSLAAFVERLKPPRVVWFMVPVGAPTEATISRLEELLQRDDVIIDGGNTFYQDDIARAAALRQQGIHHLDVGTSGACLASSAAIVS